MTGIDGYPGAELPSTASAAALLELVALYPNLRKPNSMCVVDGNFELAWKGGPKHVAVKLFGYTDFEVLWADPPRIGNTFGEIVHLLAHATFYGYDDILFKAPKQCET